MRVAKIAFFLAACFSEPLLAKCWSPFGCGPKSYDECIAQSAAMPTEAGVKLSAAQCRSKFKDELERKERAEAEKNAKAANDFAATWDGLGWGKDTPVDFYTSALGSPFIVNGPYSCTAAKSLPKPPSTGCYTYRWKDDRQGMNNFNYFTIEVVNSPGKPVWAKWENPIPVY